jgi:DNA-binding ferritin-like protein
VREPGLRSLHLRLDDIADYLRDRSDALAERRVALRVAADGRVSALSAMGAIDPLPAGWLATLVIELVAGLEQHAWMLRAESAAADA